MKKVYQKNLRKLLKELHKEDNLSFILRGDIENEDVSEIDILKAYIVDEKSFEN